MTATEIRDLGRLSLNQITVDQLSLPEAIDACARLGISWIAPWRHKLAGIGGKGAGRMVRDAGLKVSSLCRGGFFVVEGSKRSARHDDNRRAVDEAVELGTNVLVLVCGGMGDVTLDRARALVAEGIEELVPYARAAGVQLAIEPLHPMFAADRSVVVTLRQALELADRFDHAEVGVIVDAYHVWWDPCLYDDIARARGRIVGFHVSDWTVPTPELLAGRGMMGTGVIDLRRIRHAVEEAGFAGPIEVEILNRELWATPADEVLSAVKQSYLDHV